MDIELSKVQEHLDWLKKKLFLNLNAKSASRRRVKRGQVYWCDFGINIGSEMSKLNPRPAVIIQSNRANVSSSNTIVLPITHDNATLPCLVTIQTYYDENHEILLDGQVNTSNISCVSKARLGDYIVNLSHDEMVEIDKSLAIQIGLYEKYNDLLSRLERKDKYIEALRKTRNEAQDELTQIRNKYNIADNASIVDFFENNFSKKT